MDSKILPYLEKIVSNLIRDTEYKIHTVNYGGTIGDLLVDIYFVTKKSLPEVIAYLFHF